MTGLPGRNSLLTDAFERLFGPDSGHPHPPAFPGSRNEEYRYTPVDRIITNHFTSLMPPTGDKGTKPAAEQQLLAKGEHFPVDALHLVLLNGVLHSTSQEGNAGTVQQKWEPRGPQDATVTGRQDPFFDYASLFCRGTLEIEIHTDSAPATVCLYHLLDPRECNFFNTRVRTTTTGTGHVHLLEKTIPIHPGPFFHNKLHEISVAKGASLGISRVQHGGKDSFSVENDLISQDRDSRFYSNTFTFSGSLVRNNLQIALQGEGAEAYLNGYYFVGGNTHVDHHTVVDHRVPNAYSDEIYKGILDGRSQAVFNGKIFVQPDAQKTNAYQTNNNILLSDKATIHTKPQLEIWADDVKCSHGCTVGQLDARALYYLRSRGLSHSRAMQMLLSAFGKPALRHVPFDFIRDALEGFVTDQDSDYEPRKPH